MLATLAAPPLEHPHLAYEPKYDGIRALIEVAAKPAGQRQGTPVLQPRDTGAGIEVRIWSRLGNDKTAQFPSLARALQAFAEKSRTSLLVDGEIVALDSRGRPAGFQRLQGRIHLTGSRDVERLDRAQPVSLILFDLLRDGDQDLRGLPLSERRARLERRFEGIDGRVLRISEQAVGDGRALYQRALKEGWEGLIAKDVRSPYHAGRRSPAWRKLKVVRQQEFVVGGWTEPRHTRQFFGALLLGIPVPAGSHRAATSNGSLKYVGHTGTGFGQPELERVWKLLKARETTRCPFNAPIKTNEPAHWVRPELVAQVRFTEWTDDERLRHPVYLGLREDTDARTVRREESDSPRNTAIAKQRDGTRTGRMSVDAVVEQLRALEEARKDGTLELPDGSRLGVTNLAKVFWPNAGLTKGDLLRYYALVSPLILPAVADRPLVMKRFPNGIGAPAFYQQRSRQEKPPRGVRIEQLADDLDPISEPDRRRFVGGSLITLLYMAQIAAISQDPWFSRVQSPHDADYVALDLDPGDETPFARVLDAARWVRDELESLKISAVPKTSGSRGLHIYVPLPAGTSYESGLLFCQIIATIIASRHPKVATVERTRRARGRGTVYVDYLQNILGKTLATAYSARASEFAGVSTPLTWREVDGTFDPRDFTIVTAPARFAATGDLWARLRTSKPADLEAVFRKYAK
jgi:bifunctional non-homologous end joining protein LigD